jgi:hypothetical protein
MVPLNTIDDRGGIKGMAKGKSRKKGKGQSGGPPRYRVNGIELIFGLVLTLFGVLFMLGMGQVKTLTCNRLEPSQIECLMQARLLGIISLKRTPVEGLQGAKIEMETRYSQDSDGRSRNETFYTVYLLTKAGQIEFDASGNNTVGSREQTAQQINDFINNPSDKSLQVQSDRGHFFLLLAPLLFLTLGLLALGKCGRDFVRMRAQSRLPQETAPSTG